MADVVWEPSGPPPTAAISALSQFLIEQGLFIGSEVDRAFQDSAPAFTGITVAEFTLVVTESIYFLMAWTDLVAYRAAGPEQRSLLVRSLALSLNGLLTDERLAFHPKFRARVEVSPGVFLFGLDRDCLNNRTYEYGRCFSKDLDLEKAVAALSRNISEYSLACLRPEVQAALMTAVAARLGLVVERVQQALANGQAA